MNVIKNMRMFITFFSTNLLWHEGRSLFLLNIFLIFFGFFFFLPLLYTACIFFCFCLFFFRNPERKCQKAYHEHVIVSPADGKIVDIQYNSQDIFDGYHRKISIFLSPCNVHVNWLPVNGIVEKIEYHRGQFVPAFLPKSSHLNERNDVHLRMQNGKKLIIRQIAGTIARTIRCWIRENEHIQAGQKYGMIKFGSRVEVFLPYDVEIVVQVGNKVYGGYTIIGRWLP